MSHALLSPSAAHRWMLCTPSVRMEERIPERRSEYADEGTLAHTLAELELSCKYGNRPIAAEEEEAVRKAIYSDPLFKPEMPIMVGHFVDYVSEQWEAMKQSSKVSTIGFELKLDLTRFLEDGFGTGDVGMCCDEYAQIIDLKYGKGVPVYADHNEQLMLYALGVLEHYALAFTPKMVKVCIMQPRLDSVSEWEISTEELYEWAEKELAPKAKLAYAGEGAFLAGDHCRFCKAKAVCRAFADYNLELAKLDFKDPDTLTDEEIAEVLSRASVFTQWLSAVSDYALMEATHNGKRWPGFKLVEGRSNRKYVDENKVREALIAEGYDESAITTEPKLLGITAMESLLTKKRFAALLGEHVTKPQGAPTLVPSTDKRQEKNGTDALAEAFADAIVDN